jgi:tRNA threonylcarbamoyl adenosine modification protein (Sua5/YciO/YrdC/YwlC family)
MHLRINEENINTSDIHKIVDCLKNGGVIIYPTDTVYALGCSMNSTKGVEKLCRLKKVNPEKAKFSFVFNDLSHLSEYTSPFSTATFRIIKKALPGPYTFILEANHNIPKLLKQKRKTVGIRIPKNKICQEIIQVLGNPLLSGSLHDEDDDIVEYFSDPTIIHEQFENKVDMVVDGGHGNLYPSTIIDFSSDPPEIIREGLGNIDILG